MKSLALVLTTLSFLAPALAQEKVPLEEAQKGARLVTKSVTGAGPLEIEVNLDEPDAIKGGEVGILIVPDSNLTGKALAKTGSEVVPLGQLWMFKVAPAVNGKAIANDKMRLVTVRDGDNEAKVQLYTLGSRKNEKGGLDLVVYAKEKQPLLTVPMEKIETDQQLPIELQGQKRDEDSGILTLNILGRYKAALAVVKHGSSD